MRCDAVTRERWRHARAYDECGEAEGELREWGTATRADESRKWRGGLPVLVGGRERQREREGSGSGKAGGNGRCLGSSTCRWKRDMRTQKWDLPQEGKA